MFDFLDSDWFNIGLQILFLVLVIFDIKKYIETKKREYIVNIVLTIGFAIWTLLPYYKSYFEWTDVEKSQLLHRCDDAKDAKLCQCQTDAIFQEYSFQEYNNLDKKSQEYAEFQKDSKEECLDDSWF